MARLTALGLAAGLVLGGAAAAAPPPAVLDPAAAEARTRCAVWQDPPPYILQDSPAVRRTPGVSRRGGTLRVRSEIFRDVTGEQEMDGVRHFYAGRMTAAPADVVVLAPYEGQEYILVHTTARDRISLPGLPVVAPGGRLMAAVSSDATFGNFGLVIVEVTPQGFTPVARFPTVSRPCDLRWSDHGRLDLMITGVGPEPGETHQPAYAERRGGRWVLVGPRDQVTASE